MTYGQTLEWMFAQLPMYQQKGKAALNHKLDNIQRLASHLNNPDKKFKSIHVAGTNGKGSSSHMLASILQEASYKVGLYTSPHLKDFRERIRINGKPLSKQFVVDFITEHRAFFERNQLSFFEMTVGMAFDYFAKRKVDIAVIEVGLGGRLDSTNIISPEVSLITNIGFDHTDTLGDTLDKIAYEKGGIIKNGIPVIVSEYQEEIAEVFENIALEKNSKLIFADRIDQKPYKTSLLGNYQAKNVKGVVATLKELKGFEIREVDVIAGLQKIVENTGLMGRWQVLGRHPKIVCDTAHNTEGLQLVLAQISKQEYDMLHLVLGFVKDKNLETILPLFPKDAVYYFSRPNIPRGLDGSFLKEKAAKFGLKGTTYTSVMEALKAARKNASKNDFIFVGGSNFTVAEAL
ncbi:bifunctional folylpolyglutamate synthase/dihydrofolate synthase [Flavobacteriaceae bacterium TP-CH-4]|uniref:Dihydrofolate synthase/folylpolyglutamate synthase n=1 Tax=Pelagihabitans pacificus TaxID=2696054 RepID=A0A967AVP6_9FLAO|nr:folylpolyglutamate synthase/dihydrofolate synthase family protein [Pelagihabitans pacificus]NHF61058.1 bifunctional folylpolyglutamate synthase/dihydrofolate synthase [Pelagihabitans pacificus]